MSGSERRRVAGRARSDERGQVLIIFVGLFTVILLLGAFAIDQGLWLGRHRVVQKDADTAARAGALALVEDPTDLEGAESQAQFIATKNGAVDVGGLSTFTGSADCTDFRGNVLSGVPSIAVGLAEPSPHLFSSLGVLTGGGSSGPANIGAHATACVGSVNQIGAGATQTIPIAARYGDTDCFGGSPAVDLKMGYQCSIEKKFDSLTEVPEDGVCSGGGNPSHDIAPAIENGTGGDFTCSVNDCTVTETTCSSSGCTHAGSADCTSPRNGTIGHNDAVAGFSARLGQTDPCTTSLDGATAFAATFDRVDGQAVGGPPGLGGTDPAGTLYVEKQCRSTRLVLIFITDSTGEALKGFATVYLVGCDDMPPALDTQLDRCVIHGDEGNVEVRGIPLQLFLSDDAVRGIGAPVPGTPQAILMFR